MDRHEDPEEIKAYVLDTLNGSSLRSLLEGEPDLLDRYDTLIQIYSLCHLGQVIFRQQYARVEKPGGNEDEFARSTFFSAKLSALSLPLFQEIVGSTPISGLVTQIIHQAGFKEYEVQSTLFELLSDEIAIQSRNETNWSESALSKALTSDDPEVRDIVIKLIYFLHLSFTGAQ